MKGHNCFFLGIGEEYSLWTVTKVDDEGTFLAKGKVGQQKHGVVSVLGLFQE